MTPLLPAPRLFQTRSLSIVLLLMVVSALPGQAEDGVPRRSYENRLVRMEQPEPLLTDYPEFFQPIEEEARFEAPVLVNDDNADFSVRACRFS